mmetsp:Transcript_1574/g.4418  ORF Transcript_1574/g.4418 Transcript_1574/m.4418 type:complete len:231 (+) Transcript_1574:132-824(+)|eukprot:CAMPEP_0185210846 /NCGR_PEP_ID=MMETSP1140-20130426/66397_1 /TAXON_ID=298111 /ORGANISM="Pavlova sp., Strain CCMP459" /LENGTH=230 /DNA_ID=CAMNT_0027778673 /DNA_START=140 /DNA_END=832 /DNA_ORIENTATION=-
MVDLCKFTHLEEESTLPREYVRLHKAGLVTITLGVLCFLGFASAPTLWTALGGVLLIVGGSVTIFCRPKSEEDDGQTIALLGQMLAYMIACILHIVALSVMFSTWGRLREQHSLKCEALKEDTSFDCDADRDSFLGVFGAVIWPAAVLAVCGIVCEVTCLWFGWRSFVAFNSTGADDPGGRYGAKTYGGATVAPEMPANTREEYDRRQAAMQQQQPRDVSQPTGAREDIP